MKKSYFRVCLYVGIEGFEFRRLFVRRLIGCVHAFIVYASVVIDQKNSTIRLNLKTIHFTTLQHWIFTREGAVSHIKLTHSENKTLCPLHFFLDVHSRYGNQRCLRRLRGPTETWRPDVATSNRKRRDTTTKNAYCYFVKTRKLSVFNLWLLQKSAENIHIRIFISDIHGWVNH